MFWILAFFAAGGSYLLARSMAGLVMVGAIALPFGIALLLVQWVNDVTGINYFIIRSFQTLSGSQTPDGVFACGSGAVWENGALGGILSILAVLALWVPLMIAGLVGMFGTPIGVLVTFFGGIGSLITRSSDMFLMGLATLTAGLGGVLAAGLLLRVIGMIAC